MLRDLFKKKESFNYGQALQALAAICERQTEYNAILPSVFYYAKNAEYVVRFECAMKEYVKKDSYFYAIRREEKLKGRNLPELLSFAISYAYTPDAFSDTPVNLPEGITMRVKIFKRIPNQFSISNKV